MSKVIKIAITMLSLIIIFFGVIVIVQNIENGVKISNSSELGNEYASELLKISSNAYWDIDKEDFSSFSNINKTGFTKVSPHVFYDSSGNYYIVVIAKTNSNEISISVFTTANTFICSKIMRTEYLITCGLLSSPFKLNKMTEIL